MSFTDIEKELEARFIKGLRRIFEFDNEFMYNVSNEETKIIITPDFPDIDKPFKIPHIVVTGIAYQTNAQFGFNNNFFQNVPYNNIRNYAKENVFDAQYSVSLVCLGEYDVSRNLANRGIYYIMFHAYDYLSGNLKLNIQNATKSPTSLKEPYPEKVFQTPISVQGVMTLGVVKTPFNYMEGGKSLPIDKSGKTFTAVKVTVDNK